MVLDGFGLSENKEYNAIEMANTPVIDKLMAECPFVKGYASGLSVGLPDGQMGNSEVGHMNIGSGRTVRSTTAKRRIQTFTFGVSSLTAAFTHTTHTFMQSLSSARRKASTEFMFILSSTDVTHLRYQVRITSRLL